MRYYLRKKIFKRSKIHQIFACRVYRENQKSYANKVKTKVTNRHSKKLVKKQNEKQHTENIQDKQDIQGSVWDSTTIEVREETPPKTKSKREDSENQVPKTEYFKTSF